MRHRCCRMTRSVNWRRPTLGGRCSRHGSCATFRHPRRHAARPVSACPRGARGACGTRAETWGRSSLSPAVRLHRPGTWQARYGSRPGFARRVPKTPRRPPVVAHPRHCGNGISHPSLHGTRPAKPLPEMGETNAVAVELFSVGVREQGREMKEFSASARCPILSHPPWSSRFAALLHSVLRPSPSRGAPGSSLGGLGRGWVCLQGPARGVRLDTRANQPEQGAHGRMATCNNQC